MPLRVEHLEDMPRLPRDIRGDIYCIRALVEAMFRPIPSLDAIREIWNWLVQWLPSTCPRISWPPEEIGVFEGGIPGILWLNFDEESLAKFCAEWETPDGVTRDPRFQCYVLRHEDYLREVRKLVSERWGVNELPLPGKGAVVFWDCELSTAQNRERLQDICWLRAAEGLEETKFDDLSTHEQERLEHLNDKLRQLEKWIFSESMAIRGVSFSRDGVSRKKTDTTVDPFSDGSFELNEMKIVVDYAVGEHDPSYKENDDCYLYQFERGGFDLEEDPYWENGITEGLYAPTCIEGINGPASPCYLFHQLNRSSSLDLKDLLRIGDVFVNLIYVGEYSSGTIADPNDKRPRRVVTRITWDGGKRTQETVSAVPR